MHVFSNTAASVDGKIATRRHDHVSLGSDEDRRWMSELRARADAVLVGGRTFRNWPLPLVEDPAHLGPGLLPRRQRGLREPVINAVLTRQGVLQASPRPGTWPAPTVELLVFACEGVDELEHRQRFGAQVLPHAEPGVRWVISELAARGCREVLVEGGGDLIFQLLKADLLDEMFVTVCPKIVGGAGAPSPVDGDGYAPSDFPALRLLGSRQIGDEIYLRYAVKRVARC